MADANEILETLQLAQGKYLLTKMRKAFGPELWPFVRTELMARISTTVDELLPGNRFRYAGQIHEMRPVPWKLLNAMWGYDERNMHDVDDEVWEVAEGTERKAAIHDLKAFLESIGYPRYVSKARSSDSLVWKAF